MKPREQKPAFRVALFRDTAVGNPLIEYRQVMIALIGPGQAHVLVDQRFNMC